MQSTEYPDLKFVPARAFGTGRDGRAVRYIVIHYTAGSERATSAENGASNDATRTDGTSCHYFVDSDSVVQCVLTKNRANSARHRGNRLGIQYELCGTVQTRAQWLDAASLPTLRNAARQVARDCRKYDIPVRRLSVAETRRAWTEFPNGPKGIVGHVDCTFAYPEDGGDHTDPGTAFPWDLFLDMVREELEDDMALTAGDVWDAHWGDLSAGDALLESRRNSIAALAGINALTGAVGKVLANVVADDGEREAILASIEQSRAELTAAIGQVDEQLFAKLSDPATPDQQLADAIVSLLGDRKDTVLPLLR